SHATPSHRSSSRIVSTPPATLRAASVSSMRSSRVPSFASAKRRFATALNALPRWSEPVRHDVGIARGGGYERQHVPGGDPAPEHAGAAGPADEPLHRRRQLLLLGRSHAALETADEALVREVARRRLAQEPLEARPGVGVLRSGDG